MTKNLIMHLKTKHIQILHHFIRDHVQMDDNSLRFIRTDLQLANIFTKPFDEKLFAFIHKELGMLDPFINTHFHTFIFPCIHHLMVFICLIELF